MSKTLTGQVRSRIIGTLKEGIPKRPRIIGTLKEGIPKRPRIKIRTADPTRLERRMKTRKKVRRDAERQG